MDKRNKDHLQSLAQQCMFNCSEEELIRSVAEFEVLEKQMELLNRINTEGVEEMVYPFETETSYLREDTVSHVISQEEAMKNVAKVKSGHVVVPKVVK
ncbi:MAG: Asp-tRNA(Asn)/Glu-tRNA(Gln) amidotransferase subunit GatC [Anaerorhabdus sp.]